MTTTTASYSPSGSPHASIPHHLLCYRPTSAMGMGITGPTSGPSRSRTIRPSLSTSSSTPAPSHHRKPLPRSTSAYARSPSRLPNTDTLSYFPPFESMGSTSASDDDDDNEHHKAGRSSTVGRGSQHSKGRSLGSLAGIMSFLSPTAVNPPLTIKTKLPSSKSSTSISRSADGAVLEALSKRVTPGKRRVLEPMTVENEEIKPSVPVPTVGRVAPRIVEGRAQHKRRFGSEAEVENLLSRRRDRATSGKVGELVDELVVEDLVGDATPTGQLSLPLPSFPTWRYPTLSPPLASICPDIPPEAFVNPIDNPLSASVSIPASLTRSQHRTSTSSSNLSKASMAHDEDDFDQVEDDLSPTASTSVQSLSNPETPREKTIPVKITFASPQILASGGTPVSRGGSMKEEKWWREKMEQGSEWDAEKTVKGRSKGGRRESWSVEMSPRATLP